MKIPRQTKNAYDPDFASFMQLVKQESSTVYFLNASCVRSKMVCIMNEDKRKPRPLSASSRKKTIQYNSNSLNCEK